MTLYKSNIIGNAANCLYPHKYVVTNEQTLREAVDHDYVCAEYKDNYRNGANFIISDCIGMDCDNDHSENPAEWVTPADVAEAFPGVSFAVHYSRFNNREKNGKRARPKFHVLFPIIPVSDAEKYANMKKLTQSVFPYFDTQALDAARCFFGTPNPEVAFFPGTITLTEYLSDDTFAAYDALTTPDGKSIPSGQRNSTMSKFAARVIKKYGDTEKAYDAFINESAKCVPLLDDAELETIWRSAQSFYAKISKQEGYIPPDEYNRDTGYKPSDFTDLGEAQMLAEHFKDKLRYSPATHYIRYKDNYWQESEPGAQAAVHELTGLQLKEARAQFFEAYAKAEETDVLDLIAHYGTTKAPSHMDEEQLEIFKEYQAAKEYQAFVIKRRDSRAITATLKEVRPMLEVSTRDLDADGFALCTPAATYDLRKGMNGARDHSPDDLITKITCVSPGTKGQQIWEDCLNLIFQNNQELIDYVQMICGLAAIGKVYVEALIIAYGDGRNGKSTFWNAISRVLGLYSGNISADALTTGCRRNIKPEMAEVKGKRLLIASEMQEGARLNDSTVKQLCSTDDIFAEKKYKDPFSFTPCHTLVLYTNHLPRVSATDDGIWRRLIVIPFNAKITGNNDIKNYGEYLFENAGEAILAWIIEGSKKVIDVGYQIPVPACVQDAIEGYRSRNDWFAHFLEDKCDIDENYEEKSSSLYQVYRNYCMETNEYTRNTTDFYAALEKAGFTRRTLRGHKLIRGLRIRQDDSDFDEFLS